MEVSHGFKPTHVLILLLLLIPSAAFVWRNSDVPQFGDIHDDSVYFVSAKSLAGGSYRIESLPTRPFQTKYPPLYPLLLSIAWRMNPQFPQNLTMAVWLTWAALPAMLGMLALLFPRMGVDGWRKWLLLTALALNPYTLLFSATLLSELWFTALLALSLFLTERATDEDSGAGWAVASGVVAGLAYLVRSAGIVLLVSGVIYLVMRKRRSQAIAFGVAMFPFVAGWMLWARLHQAHTGDMALVYYTDYFRYEVYNFSIKTFHLFLWKNIDGLVSSLGYWVLPNVTSSLFMKILADVIGVGMISGTIRMVRSGRAVQYTMFAAGAAFMLVIWHFPPNERFVQPLVPLAYAGLLTELERFAAMTRGALKHRDMSQRVAAVLMAGLLVVALGESVRLQAFVGSTLMNEVADQQRHKNIDHRGAYAWIRANLPADAAVEAYNDPVMYLYTGRRSISRPLPPYIWYTDDHARAVELYKDLASYALDHGAGYVYYTTADLRRDMGDSDTTSIEDAIRANPEFNVLYQSGIATIYGVDLEPDRAKTANTSAPSATMTNPGQVVAGR